MTYGRDSAAVGAASEFEFVQLNLFFPSELLSEFENKKLASTMQPRRARALIRWYYCALNYAGEILFFMTYGRDSAVVGAASEFEFVQFNFFRPMNCCRNSRIKN